MLALTLAALILGGCGGSPQVTTGQPDGTGTDTLSLSSGTGSAVTLPEEGMIKIPHPSLGQDGEYAIPLSATTRVPLEDGISVHTFDELSRYLHKTEKVTAKGYENYPTMDVGIAVYYDDTDLDGNGEHDAVEIAREYKGYHQNYLGTKGRDVILYATNFRGERIGTEDDVSILWDYIDDGYVVILVDFNKNELSCSPNIEHTLGTLHAYYKGTKSGVQTNENYFYTLPCGYRLERGVWFWNLYYHSSLGTREATVNSWNKNYVDKAGSYYTENFTSTYDTRDENGNVITVKREYEKGQNPITAEHIEDCVMRDGSNLRYDHFLDITYPSLPKKSTPVYIMASSSTDLQKMSVTEARCTFAGFAFSGYTTVAFEYVYKPMVRSLVKGDLSSYGYDSQNITKITQAAIRCVRYYAKDYGYDATRIGAAGISKASRAASVLSVVNNETISEDAVFDLDKAARKEYGVASALEGDILLDGEYLYLQQPFLYYDVPYGPIYNEDGSVSRDIYGNIITYDYYGREGIQLVRAAAEGDLRDSHHFSKDLEETDAGFRTASGVSIAEDYASVIETRAETEMYEKDGIRLVLGRSYGTEDKNALSSPVGQNTSYYHYIDTDTMVAYCAAGDGANRYFAGFDDREKVPMILSCGATDEYKCFTKWTQILESFLDEETPYFPNTMMEQGHAYPGGYDMIRGYYRHDAYMRFFDHYLKPEEYDFADLIWASPVAGNTLQRLDTKIEFKFYTPMEASSVEKAVAVSDDAGNAVSGTWTVSEGGTLFSFTPSELWKPNTSYTVKLNGDEAKNENGIAMRESYSGFFKTMDAVRSVLPVSHAYVSTASSSKAYHSEVRWQPVLNVDAKQRSFVTFKTAELVGMDALRLEATMVSENTEIEILVHEVYMVDPNSLSHSTRPGNGRSVGVVMLDENGYGLLDISSLSLGNGENVTFELKIKQGSAMFESLSGLGRGVGITAIGK